MHLFKRGPAALMSAALLLASPTAYAAGLSDQQRSHIQDYVDCSILLLTDIEAFADTEPCGGAPSGSKASLNEGSDGSGCEYRQPGIVALIDYCYEYDQQ